MRRLVLVFATAAAVMLGAFRFAGWYADNAALPRYCGDPEKAIEITRKILTEENPVGDRKKRDFIVAAKLLFLVPQEEGEETRTYLARLSGEISARCGRRF